MSGPWAMVLRSFAMQASWNHRTLLGGGFAFSLLPVLRRVYRGQPQALAEAVGRHAEYFNAHPYLASVALGAVAQMEVARSDAAAVSRLKAGLVSPLGTLGDRLVWARWRPLCALVAIAAFFAGLPWWAAVALFLGAYNVVHLGLRIWGMRLGWHEARQVGRALSRSAIRRIPDRLTLPLAASAGVLLALLTAALVRRFELPLPLALGAAVAAAGLRWPVWAGRVASAAIVGSALVGALLGAFSR